MTIVVVSKQDVERLLPMRECIGLMEAALASLARGEVIHPLRPVVSVPDTANAFAVMPAYSSALKAFGTKIISVYPDNHGTEVDSHQGVVVLFDGERGSPVAIIDAASITAMRTAAVSAVATKLLARADATTLAILGAGVQARTHVAAMLAVLPFQRVVLWSRSVSKARQLADELAAPHAASVDVAGDAHSAVTSADVVCTVTAAREPVLRGEWLRPGMHVNAVGASLRSARELDTEAVTRSRVFVDRRESALHEAGDILIPMQEGAMTADAIVAEIGELLIGKAEGRQSPADITLFKSLGLAVEDLACARYLFDAARREDAGQRVSM